MARPITTCIIFALAVMGMSCTPDFNDLSAADRQRVCAQLHQHEPDALSTLSDPAISLALRAQTTPSMGDIGDLALHVHFDAMIGPDGRIERVKHLRSDVPYASQHLNGELVKTYVGKRLIEGIGRQFQARVDMTYEDEATLKTSLVGKQNELLCEP